MSNPEQEIREYWNAFCKAAKAAAENLKVVPGRTLDDAPMISAIGELPKDPEPAPVVEPKPEPKPIFGSKKDNKAD